ncbi:hypothetical protein HWB91_gp16 [Bacillus phage vB_BboS-125]|uniref:Uncharacterized protein n=1 Tax=Bacillus phage vB_BboS-125 TaxID=2419618 RepID=A0A3G3BWA5_9CAUD|nr:hypothetical protein HWB91_gp16 [Bacillus phage vB_BboS-125]AYP68386.1 hypothetical protein BboS125_00016 [Bacillus phage vB_BboS-125]
MSQLLRLGRPGEINSLGFFIFVKILGIGQTRSVIHCNTLVKTRAAAQKEGGNMFHWIDRIVAADEETLKRLAADARNRAKYGTGGQYKMDQELIAEACEREIEIRKKGAAAND